MKCRFACLLLALAPLAAHAACSPSDFQIEGFKIAQSGSGFGTRLSLRGHLVNHCAQAAAAQISIDAKDASGRVLMTKKGWPAGTSNIPPGQSVDFDLGRLFHYQTDMASYTVGVADVRTW